MTSAIRASWPRTSSRKPVRWSVLAVPREAIELFEAHPPAVLLADIAMPTTDGYELLRQVRALPQQRGGAVPAVAVTAFAHPEGRRRSYAAGFQVHLAKPLNRAELLDVIARLVPKPQP